MKKITNLIVNGRYVFLALFIIVACFSLYLSTKVNINEDIMKYLPETSETKIGKDIMDKEFAKQDSSILNVMFKGLSENEKDDTLKKLENVVITFIAIIMELEKLDEEERLRDIIQRAKKKIYATWITTTIAEDPKYYDLESKFWEMPEGIELLEILDEVDNEKY